MMTRKIFVIVISAMLLLVSSCGTTSDKNDLSSEQKSNYKSKLFQKKYDGLEPLLYPGETGIFIYNGNKFTKLTIQYLYRIGWLENPIETGVYQSIDGKNGVKIAVCGSKNIADKNLDDSSIELYCDTPPVYQLQFSDERKEVNGEVTYVKKWNLISEAVDVGFQILDIRDKRGNLLGYSYNPDKVLEPGYYLFRLVFSTDTDAGYAKMLYFKIE